MGIVARKVHRLACGVAFVGAVAACGSGGEAGPYGGELGIKFGFVGSGGGGLGYSGEGGTTEGGTAEGDGGRRDGGLDGGRGGPESDSGGGGSPGHDAGTISGGDASVGGSPDAGSTVAVTFALPPGLFSSLDWVISGPSGYYSGTVYFGDAHSLEFVQGGIRAGSGYTITLAGNDRYGDPCSGTSAPFEVFAGQVSGSSVVLTCDVPLADASEPADVTTGAVGVEAGVALGDP